MTKEAPEGFVRLSSGILTWRPGFPSKVTYKTPDEAIVMPWAGKYVLRCNEKVFKDWSSGPCQNKAKYDPDENGNPTKCGHHRAEAKTRKKLQQEERDRKRMAALDYKIAKGKLTAELTQIVKAIAEGHNDARGLCLDWVNRNNKLEEEKEK